MLYVFDDESEILYISMINVDKHSKSPLRIYRQSSKVLTFIVILVRVKDTGRIDVKLKVEPVRLPPNNSRMVKSVRCLHENNIHVNKFSSFPFENFPIMPPLISTLR